METKGTLRLGTRHLKFLEYLMRNDGLENLKLTGYTDDKRSTQNNRENLTSFFGRSVIAKLSGQI